MNQGVFRIVAAILVLAFVGFTGWEIWQRQHDVHAPRDPGVCWRMGADGTFTVLVRGSSGIEACAGDLERVFMKTHTPVNGAYQGRYIFIDKEAIRSADTLTGERWRLYFDNQRRDLDKDLNARPMIFTTQR
jgi:hypothetical protein